jgi:hypothetical protein
MVVKLDHYRVLTHQPMGVQRELRYLVKSLTGARA